MSQATLEEPRTDTGVEANARLTSSTGAVLLVLLFFEGLTLVAIGRCCAGTSSSVC